jgi:hypothetical protein
MAMPIGDMRLNMEHTLCGTELVGVGRAVLTQPEDNGWPKDNQIRVPYCPTCRKLVTIDHVQTSRRG